MDPASIFPALIQNTALLLAMAFIYDVLTSRHRLENWPLPVQVAVGAVLGILGIIIMLSSWIYVPGIIFDTRSVLLGIAGLFFGVVPTAVAMVMTAIFRLSQGGTATLTGVAVICTTGTLGIIWRHHRRRPLEELTWKELYLFGLIIHLGMLALMLTLPWPTALQVLTRITPPVLAIYPVATALLGLLMVVRLRREGIATLLATSEERLRLALAAANQGLYDLNVQTGEAQVSQEYATMLGYDPATFRETNARWLEHLHPDDYHRVAAVYRDYVAGTIPEYRVEFRQRTRTGEWKWILSVGKVVEYDAEGRPLRMLGTHTDITERKQVEEALRESEESYRTLINNLPGLTYRCLNDEHRTLLFFSEGVKQMTGYPASDFIRNAARSYASIINPEDRLHVNRAVQDGVNVHHPYELEYRLIRADGTIIWVYEKGQGVFDAAGKLLWLDGVIIDITELRQAHAEKERLQAQLLQAQKMESVGRLAGGVAHDFNNMLQTILGYCDLTLCELEAESPLQDNIREIRKAAVRSADLTRQLLAFARKQTAAPRVLDLNETVAGMLKMLQRLIGEDIELVWAPGPDLWRVKIDPSQLDQVLANLAVNARDAISDTGKITIATENTQLDAAHCAGRPECLPGDYVMLTVSDTGCGMDQATITQIFEPFFTTKEQGKGTGLGLATVYGIIRQNHGFVKVRSFPDQGTTFRIYLPRVTAELTDSPLASVVVTPAGGGTETVLLVEDEEAILKLGKAILELGGYHVLVARQAAEAIRLAQEHPGRIHLLVTDVVMPEMNGRELAQTIMAQRPGIRCLYMSGYTADIVAQHGVLEEGVHFIQKPFSVRDFSNAVRRALEHQPTEKKQP
jgi:PAS domain S-box-containing protein